MKCSPFLTVSEGGAAVHRKPANALLVNPDAVLHAFHKFFENSLKYLEKHDLAEMLRAFVKNIQTLALRYKAQSSGELANHYELIAAQFTVPLILIENAQWQGTSHTLDSEETEGDDTDNFANALKLLARFSTEFSPETRKKIEQELRLIYDAKAQDASPLFARYASEGSLQSDYTQYRPRSHYANASTTRAYFRTMMYLGRKSYFLGNHTGITDALLVMHLMAGNGAGGVPIIRKWQEIMEITGFYAGTSDDICYPELKDFVVKTLGKDSFSPEDALNPETLEKISNNLQALRPPRILSETGISVNTLQRTKEQRLQEAKAFRVFGQRFTFDGWGAWSPHRRSGKVRNSLAFHAVSVVCIRGIWR